jgi:hypothetical protein
MSARANRHSPIKRVLATVVILGVVAAGSAIGLFISREFGSHAVQAPEIRLDMNSADNTYDDSTNTMSVGATEGCLTTSPGNNSQHNHTVHLVVKNVEDLAGWQVRLNYDGAKMRPSAVNFAPFTDNNTSQQISFLNLPIDSGTTVHHNLLNAGGTFPGASGPQTALMGAIFTGRTLPVSPDTPAKSTPDDNSYSAPSGGVLAAITLQVPAGNAGRLLSIDLDDANPNRPGSKALIFTGSGQQTVNLPDTSLGDGFHAEGVPWAVPPGDADCDGFSTTVENSAGTDPNRPCGTNAWPPDINNDTFVDVIGDISQVSGQFGNSVPPAPTRYDIAPDPPDHHIDVIGDISKMAGFFSLSCS